MIHLPALVALVGLSGPTSIGSGLASLLCMIAASAPSAVLAQATRRPRTRSPRYEAIEVTDGGSIVGRVIWKGAIPPEASKKVAIPAEMSGHCGASQKLLSRLVIDPDHRGVKNVVVYLQDIAKGKPMPQPGTNIATGEKAVLNQIQCMYDPHVLVVGQRTTLAIASSDETPHNVNARMGTNQIFNLHFPKKGIRVEDPKRTNVGRKTGIITLRCNVGHYWMSGIVMVVSHPYYTVTNEAGEFKLEDVPPGKYEMVYWHESWKPRILKDAGGKVTEILYGRPRTRAEKIAIQAGWQTDVLFDLSK